MMKLFMLINSLYLMMMQYKVNGSFWTRHLRYPLVKLVWKFTTSTKLKMILFKETSKEYLQLPQLLYEYGTFLDLVSGVLNKSLAELNTYDPVMKVMVYKDSNLKVTRYIEYLITLDTESIIALNVRKRDDNLLLTIITNGMEFNYDAKHTNQQYIIVQDALDKSVRALIHMTIKKILTDVYKLF